jgi:hypothetical protein
MGFSSPDVCNESLKDKTKAKGQGDLAKDCGFSPLSRNEDAEVECHGRSTSKEKGEDEARQEVKLQSQKGKSEKCPNGGHITMGKI